MTKASDTQIGGEHYKAMGEFQPWDVLSKWLTPEEYRGYQKGVAIAYLARERSKGGDQDIRKAVHHLQRLIEEMDRLEGDHADTAPVVFPPLPEYDPASVALTEGCCGQPNTCETPCFHRGQTVPPDSDGWINWHGGECPVAKDATVRVRYRDCADSEVDHLAWHISWDHLGTGSDIVAYKIIKQQAGSDGWIEWLGDRCPVQGDAIVEYILRNGETGKNRIANSLHWQHKGQQHDIIAYRIINPTN